jgi:thiamine-monophosphate kinase
LSITALGSLKAGSQIQKTTAKVGDALCVSGSLGEAYAGLKILLREKKYWMDHPTASTNLPNEWKSCIAAQLMPKARLDLLTLMRNHHIHPTAMVDLSKGLLNELVEMCNIGHHGAYVYEAALPISEQTQEVAIEMNEQAIAYALQGGEDYQIMFTMDEQTLERAFEYLKDITVIGMIRPASEGLQLQKFNGEVWNVDLQQPV